MARRRQVNLQRQWGCSVQCWAYEGLGFAERWGGTAQEHAADAGDDGDEVAVLPAGTRSEDGHVANNGHTAAIPAEQHTALDDESTDIARRHWGEACPSPLAKDKHYAVGPDLPELPEGHQQMGIPQSLPPNLWRDFV